MLTKKSDNRKEMLENISGIKIDFLFYPLKMYLKISYSIFYHSLFCFPTLPISSMLSTTQLYVHSLSNKEKE